MSNDYQIARSSLDFIEDFRNLNARLKVEAKRIGAISEAKFDPEKDSSRSVDFDRSEIVKHCTFRSILYNRPSEHSLSYLDVDDLAKMHDLDCKIVEQATESASATALYTSGYEQKKYAYQRQIGKLGGFFDNLKQELKQNRVLHENKEWAYHYCDIFDRWMEKGGGDSIGLLKNQILEPIQKLNEKFPESGLTPILKKDSSLALSMHDELHQLPENLESGFNELAKTLGEAQELTKQIINHLEHKVQKHQKAQKKDKSNRDKSRKGTPISWRYMLWIVGFLFLIALAFWLSYVFIFRDSKDSTPPESSNRVANIHREVERNKSHLNAYVKREPYVPIQDSLSGSVVNKKSHDAMKAYYGIDVSHHENRINWEAVMRDKEDIAFVIIKATEGAHWKDTNFISNWINARERFDLLGAYHYFTHRNPKVQARNFVKELERVSPSGSYFPIVDVESDDQMEALAKRGILVDRVKTFIAEVERATKRKVVIYSGVDFFKRNLKEGFPDQTFWLAHYCKDCHDVHDYIKNSISDGPNSQRVIAWQFTDEGQIEGIEKRVDLNYMPEYFWQELLK